MKKMLSLLILASVMLISVSCVDDNNSGEPINTDKSEVSNVISSQISDTQSLAESETTKYDREGFKMYIEEQISFVADNEEKIEEITLSYFKHMSNEEVVYSTADKDLINKWVQFLKKAEFRYEDCEFVDGAPYHELAVVLDGKEVQLERAWNTGRVYVGNDETTMAVISNFEEIRSEYETLYSLMTN